MWRAAGWEEGPTGAVGLTQGGTLASQSLSEAVSACLKDKGGQEQRSGDVHSTPESLPLHPHPL